MASGPPKAKFRGKRGGDPNRRSQRQRHDRGLVSHLDFFDPENFESDRRQQQRREDRSRSAAKAGAVAKEKAAAASDHPAPLPPPPLRNTSEVRSVPAPRTVVTTSTVSVPARPIAPPARPGDGGEGSWQLAWVWTPVAAEGVPGEAVPLTPPKAPPAKAGTAKRRSRSPIRRKISKPSAAPDRASVLAQEAATLAEALETAESAAVAESLAPAEPKVSAKKAKSPKQKRASSKPSSVSAPKDTSGVAKPSAKGTSSSSLTTPAVGVPAAVKSAPASGSKPPPKKVAAAAKGSLTSRTVQLTPAKVKFAPKPKSALPSEEGDAVPVLSRRRQADSPGAVERPLLGLDWHRTIAHERHGPSGREAFIPAASLARVQELIERGYDICIISFASAIKTQEKILELGRDFERALSRPLHSLCIVPRKFTENSASRASLTGHWESKAELVRDLGCCYYVDDQRDLLRDIASLQEGRSRAHRVKVVQADCELPSDSLKPLMDALKGVNPADLPVPSFLKSLDQ